MTRSLALVLLFAGALSNTAAAQLPSLKKIKDAAKKATTTADSVAAKKPGAENTAAPAPAAAPQASAKAAGPKVWENYDFVPGNKVIFFTDFSEDKVGNFARRLKYVSGPVEVVERDGAKVLRATGRGHFRIPLGRKLPEKFTLEIDAIAPLSGVMNEAIAFEGTPDRDAGDNSVIVTWNPQGGWLYGAQFNASNGAVMVPDAMHEVYAGKVVHLRVLMDGAYFKLYANERRLHNVPELAFHRDTVIRVQMGGTEEEGQEVYITSIRVAESETDVLYDALANKGRWATQGILFATGKAELQPESRPVLKEIAATLKEHPELKILIEGHTDNVGVPASNLTLSDARAAAVKAALVADFGIDGARVTTKGLGDTKPAMPNATAEGRAQNRRVEIVKQ
jgi:outer membrane protein OmpA-like peptidoglycan-associated protein